MNEKGLRLFDAVTDMSDEIIIIALKPTEKRIRVRSRIISAAACFAFILVICSIVFGNVFFKDVKANKSSEVILFTGYCYVKLNTEMPEGYVLQLPGEFDYNEETKKQGPILPLAHLQVATAEGDSVYRVAFCNKEHIQWKLDYALTRVQCAIIEEGEDENGNHYIVYSHANQSGSLKGKITYQYLVEFTESKNGGFYAFAFSLEDLKRFYNVLNICFDQEEDYLY